VSQPALVMFTVFLGITLVITFWASGSSQTTTGFYTAHRHISGTQNGWAIAGEYMSAASFLGVTGLIAFYGFDGFMYSVGFVVAYLAVLFLVAEPLRNAGRFTFADVIAFRLGGTGPRAVAALSTLVITLIYMVAQLVGAGSIISLLMQRIDATVAIVVVGVLVLVYVFFGGMLATTWVQIIKAGLLLVVSLVLTFLVMAHFQFSFGNFLNAAAHVVVRGQAKNLLEPGQLFQGKHGAFDVVSLGLALVLGTAGLPHLLMRFFTVPSASAARISVAWAMAVVGVFYLLTSFMGLGAATIVGEQHIGKHLVDTGAIRYIVAHPLEAPGLNAELAREGSIVPQTNSNLAAPVLAFALGGALLTAFVTAVAFAAILAVVSGLTIAASSAFAHDVWYSLIRRGKGTEGEHLFVARVAAVAFVIVSIVISVYLRYVNVAFLVGIAFAVAASANVPALVLALAWRRFSRLGALCGMIAGLVSSVALITIGPDVLAHPLFPLRNPGIVSIPIGFIAAIAGTLLARDARSEAKFNELRVRANTGLGAETS
jgi:cation/acetate symporter